VPPINSFYDGEEPPYCESPQAEVVDDIAWDMAKIALFLNKLRRFLASEEGDRKLILYMAQKMAIDISRSLFFASRIAVQRLALWLAVHPAARLMLFFEPRFSHPFHNRHCVHR